jgi:C2 domain
MVKRTSSMFEVPDYTDVLFLGRLLLSVAAMSLLWGYSSVATVLSACGGFFLRDSTRNMSTKPLEKWLVLSFFCFCVSLTSWIFLSWGTYITLDVANQYKTWFVGALLQKGMGLGIAYYLLQDFRTQTTTVDESVRYLEVRVSILEGRDLVAKDKNIWGKKVSSDPYVKVYHGPNKVGRTSIVKKTLDPKWDSNVEAFSMSVLPRALDVYKTIECNIFDHDKLSTDDAMGTCYVKIPAALNTKIVDWYRVEKGEGNNYCRNASGMLKVEVEVRSKLGRTFRSELRSTASQRFSNVSELKKKPRGTDCRGRFGEGYERIE